MGLAQLMRQPDAFSQLMNRPVADHPHVGLGNTQEPGDVRPRLLVIESHDDDRAFALLQTLHTAGEPFLIEAWQGRLNRR